MSCHDIRITERSKSSVVILSDSDSENDFEPPRKKQAVSRVPLFPPKAKHNEIGRNREPAKGLLHAQKPAKKPTTKRHATLVFSSSQASDEATEKIEHKPQADFSSQQQQRSTQEREKHVQGKTLWSQKHAPQAEEDLIVNKKKILELKEFLNSHDSLDPSQRSPCLLMLSGPPGSGKSTLLRILAQQLGFEITEWQPPVPTLWSEHSLQGAQGQQYLSKLDAFESFVSHAKLAPLSVRPVDNAASSGQAVKRRKLVLVEDLPYASASDQRKRLLHSLETLAETTRCPVVVMMTTSLSSSESRPDNSSPSSLFKGLSLSSPGAVELSLGAVSVTAISKTLQKIAEAEAVPFSPEQARGIAASASGDLLNAIETLQLFSSGKIDLSLLKTKKGKKGRQKGAVKKGKPQASPNKQHAFSALQKDVNLSTFHALGKLLYNKRQTTELSEEAAEESSLKEVDTLSAPTTSRTKERPRLVETPEDILMASGMEMPSVVAFLHENYPHFIGDDAVEDAAEVSEYFSLSDELLGRSSMLSTSEVALENLAAGNSIGEACAGAVAARGLMWANAHPAPKRWLPLKAPAWYTVNKALHLNQAELKEVAARAVDQCGGIHHMAACVTPFMRMLSNFPSAAHVSHNLPRKWSRVWQGQLITEDIMPIPASALNAADGTEMDDVIEESE